MLERKRNINWSHVNGRHSETCYKCITRISNGNKWMVNLCYLSICTGTVYAFFTHLVMAHVCPETISPPEFFVTLKISFQGSTQRIHSYTPLHDSNQKLQSMTPLHKIHSANTFAAFQGSTQRIDSNTPLHDSNPRLHSIKYTVPTHLLHYRKDGDNETIISI